MLFKRMTIISLVGLLAFSLAACSGNKPASSPTPSSPAQTSGSGATATPPPVEKDTKKHTISYLGVVYGAIAPTDGRGVQMINEKFNVEYKPLHVPDSEYGTKLSALMAANDMPDIARAGGGIEYIRWAQQGALLALDDYIKESPELQKVPDHVWDQLRVDGKIYGIPSYFTPTTGQSPVIRKDWLDKLGLEIPTNFEELKNVAIQFAKQDPGGVGSGLRGLSVDGSANSFMNAYSNWWIWYPDGKGGFIPNIIGEGRKEMLIMMAELYKEGVIDKDYLTPASGVKDFFQGKSGIWKFQPFSPGDRTFNALLEVAPEAEVVAIPPFKAPDGTQGFHGLRGWFGMTIFNSKMEKDPDKVKRILEILDFGRTFIPDEERNQNNPDFDWINGEYGQGYTLEDGKVQMEAGKGKTPKEYLPDPNMWPPSVAALKLENQYASPKISETIKSLDLAQRNHKIYMDPGNYVLDEEFEEKWYSNDGFEPRMLAEQARIVTGQISINEWDRIVQEWLDSGAAKLIEKMNGLFKEKGITPETVWVTVE